MLLLCYYYVPCYAMSGKFSFFCAFLRKKEKMTQEEKKKGKKFFVKKKLTREILFNTSSHNPICNI